MIKRKANYGIYDGKNIQSNDLICTNYFTKNSEAERILSWYNKKFGFKMWLNIIEFRGKKMGSARLINHRITLAVPTDSIMVLLHEISHIVANELYDEKSHGFFFQKAFAEVVELFMIYRHEMVTDWKPSVEFHANSIIEQAQTMNEEIDDIIEGYVIFHNLDGADLNLDEVFETVCDRI